MQSDRLHGDEQCISATNRVVYAADLVGACEGKPDGRDDLEEQALVA